MSLSLPSLNASILPTVTSTGVGSGLDISTLVTSLVKAQIQPQQTTLTTKQATDQSTVSALGAIKSALATLQTAVHAITTGHALSQLTTQTSDATRLTASTSSTAVAGTYQVVVSKLAAANVIASAPQTSASATIASGPYTITAGGSTFSVSLDSSDSTLQGLANAINTSASNSGVSATVVNAADGSRLLLSATQTGVANAVSVASGSPLTFTSVQSASDSAVSVDGFEYDSASNTVTGALTGVTLNLLKADPGTTQSLTISANQQAAASAIQAFVSAYNSAASLISQATAYTQASSSKSSSSTSGGTAGPLLGDLAVESLRRQISALVGSSTGSTSGFSMLSQIGVTLQAGGTLSMDSATVATALQQNPAGVTSLFSATGTGIGSQLSSVLENYAGADGILDGETAALQDQLTSIAGELSSLSSQQTALQQRYLAQFNAMDTKVAAYKNIQSFLTTQFAPKTTSSTSSGSG